MEHDTLCLIFSDSTSLANFIKKAGYKIKIKRYVDSINERTICFKSTLNVHEIEKVVEILQQQIDDLEIDNQIEDYITDRQFYIDSRYRVGNDIKKKDPKIIDTYSQFKFKVDRLLVRPLTNEQMWNAFYMYVMKNCSNFSVPGSGKTATVLGTYSFLKSKEEIKKIVMIGPKNAFGSWIQEYRTCFGLSANDESFFLNIHANELKTSKDRNYQLTFQTGGKSLILINYESLETLKSSLSSVIDKETLLVFDEVHKIKNPNGKRAKSAIEVSKNAGRILALTGTPIPNSYQDIFNILNLLYPEDYKDFFGFSVNELRNASPFEIEFINNKLKPFFCRVTKEEQKVPKPNNDINFKISVSPEENKLFKIIYQTYKGNLFALMARLMQLGSNPKLLLTELDLSTFKSIIDDESDYSQDVVIRDYTEDITSIVNKIDSTSKMNTTMQLIQKLSGEHKKVIVWCIFISSIQLLEKKCQESGLKVVTIYGETPLDKRLQLIEEYQQGYYDVLITNPHTLAESVSLHHFCHDAIYYEYSYNLVHLLQSKDRIHRLGLKDGQYTQYYYMESQYIYNDKIFSLDNRIYERLKEKEEVMLNAINNGVLEQVTSFEEDLELIFKDF